MMGMGETVEFATTAGASLAARRLTCADAKPLQEFYASLSADSFRWFQAHALDDETVRKAMRRSERGDDLTLGLFDGERLVGYLFLWYFNEPVPLLGVGLHDDFHGRGLGRGLMRFLMTAAEANGSEGVELTTMQDNGRAFALYQNVGFRHYKDVDNLQGDGSMVVERAMFYPIKPGAKPMQRAHEPPV